MNKGFILDGYPRSKENAKNVFMKKVPLPMEEPAEGEEAPEQQYKLEIDERIAPQYAISFEADDAFLLQKMKELPSERIDGTHWDEAGMGRRLKIYRAANPEDGGESVKDFFNEIIGYQNVLNVDASTENSSQMS
jgi:hypothetical protein